MPLAEYESVLSLCERHFGSIESSPKQALPWNPESTLGIHPKEKNPRCDLRGICKYGQKKIGNKLNDNKRLVK